MKFSTHTGVRQFYMSIFFFFKLFFQHVNRILCLFRWTPKFLSFICFSNQALLPLLTCSHFSCTAPHFLPATTRHLWRHRRLSAYTVNKFQLNCLAFFCVSCDFFRHNLFTVTHCSLDDGCSSTCSLYAFALVVLAFAAMPLQIVVPRKVEVMWFHCLFLLLLLLYLFIPLYIFLLRLFVVKSWHSAKFVWRPRQKFCAKLSLSRLPQHLLLFLCTIITVVYSHCLLLI